MRLKLSTAATVFMLNSAVTFFATNQYSTQGKVLFVASALVEFPQSLSQHSESWSNEHKQHHKSTSVSSILICYAVVT